MEMEERVQQFRYKVKILKDEIGKVIVGHEDVVEGVLTCLFAGGHCLLEGVPGLGKTLLVRTLGQALSLKFSRIQFTPDLMPADIIGTNMIMQTEDGQRHFEFRRGPLFGQIVLADEINRATPKTQSALLEAMQEHRVTVGSDVHRLQEPFVVIATQNPIEQEGTYPLPEAQLDRFFFKVLVDYSNRDELAEILHRTTEGADPVASVVMGTVDIAEGQDLVKQVIVAPHVQDYAIRLVMATMPGGEFAAEAANKHIRYGASPRGVQTIVLGAKFRALTHGRYNVAFEDLEQVYLPALRHRVILNFEAEAEGMTTDEVLEQILEATPAVAKKEAQPAV